MLRIMLISIFDLRYIYIYIIHIIYILYNIIYIIYKIYIIYNIYIYYIIYIYIYIYIYMVIIKHSFPIMAAHATTTTTIYIIVT